MPKTRPRWRDRTFYFFVDFRASAPAPWGLDWTSSAVTQELLGSFGWLRFSFGWELDEAPDEPVYDEPLERESFVAGAVPAWERELDAFVRDRGPA